MCTPKPQQQSRPKPILNFSTKFQASGNPTEQFESQTPLKPGLEHHLENRNSVLDRKPQNICLKQAAAAAAALLRRGRARPADTFPGESPPIRRIYANRDYPVAAHDQGNVTAAQETRHRGASRRYSQINASARYHCNQLNRAQRMPRDLPAVQAPTIGASGTQQRRRSNQETPRYQIGTKKANSPRLAASGESRLRAQVRRARDCSAQAMQLTTTL